MCARGGLSVCVHASMHAIASDVLLSLLFLNVKKIQCQLH